MMKHTPGPWALHEGKTAVNGADGRLVASCGFLPYRNKWDSEANARLIASAPDLLEALELIIFDIECLEPIKKHHLEEAYEAIAKAKGETK